MHCCRAVHAIKNCCNLRHQYAYTATALRMASHTRVKRCECCRNSSSPSTLSISDRSSCCGACSCSSSHATLSHAGEQESS